MNSASTAIDCISFIFCTHSIALSAFSCFHALQSAWSAGANEGFCQGTPSVYHGMMLGLCAVLSNRYRVRSNRESGIGRFDIMLIPKVKSIPAFIYEFKYTKDEKVNLDDLADEALKQIDEKKYEEELIDSDIKKIIKIGIAFRGKSAVVKK